MDLVIREATMNDLDVLVELWLELIRDQLGKDPYYKGPLEFDGGHAQFTHALNSPDCGIIVAELDNQVIGFIEIWLKDKNFYFYVEDYAYILHYIVTSKIRKDEKIYKYIYKLYRAAEDWARSKGRRFLAGDVFSHNEVVQKLLTNRAGMEAYRTMLVKDLDGGKGDRK